MARKTRVYLFFTILLLFVYSVIQIIPRKDLSEAIQNEKGQVPNTTSDSYVVHVNPVLEDDDFLIPDGQVQLFSTSLIDGDIIDFKKIGQKLRIYSELVNSISSSKKSKKRSDWLEKIESHIFPWIQQSSLDLIDSFQGTGLVMCIGNGQTKMAAAGLKMIRQVHQSTIPIEVFYLGDQDLSEANRNFLNEIPFTTTRDITKIFNNDILKLSGWAIKPFALLASSFRHAMLIDADVVFLQNPEVLFYSQLYAKNHALFFHDRSLFSHQDSTINWFKDLIPSDKLNRTQHLRVFNKKSAHEQESGVVLVDKKKNTHGLLASCTLNTGSIRSKSYDFVFGDKETFWLGFETVSASYQFNGYFPGTIGVLKEQNEQNEQKEQKEQKEKEKKYEICSRQLLHLDENESPIWINGGIQESKYDHSGPLAKMEYYTVEPGEWTLHESNMACLAVTREPKALPKVLAGILSESGSVLLETLSK